VIVSKQKHMFVIKIIFHEESVQRVFDFPGNLIVICKKRKTSWRWGQSNHFDTKFELFW